jgi:hypothetical protein
MLLPGLRERRAIDRHLRAFFARHRASDFQRAIRALSRFYRLPTPRVHWFEYLDWGRTAGYTWDNGEIHLIHPENWKRGRKYNSERRWINTVYHEMGHYVFWADAERKAETFAYRMVRRLRDRSARPAGTAAAASSLRGASRLATPRQLRAAKPKKSRR